MPRRGLVASRWRPPIWLDLSKTVFPHFNHAIRVADPLKFPMPARLSMHTVSEVHRLTVTSSKRISPPITAR